MELVRPIDPLLLAEYAKPIFYPITMVYIDAPDRELFLHDGIGSLVYGGNTWVGLGKIGSIDIPFETEGAVPEEAVLGIVGPVEELLSEAEDARIRGRQVDIYTDCTTEPGGVVLVAEPWRAFTGSMGDSSFSMDAGRRSAKFSVRIKSGQPARSGAQIAHSDEEHQAKYPGDTMFRRVTNAAKWARNPSQWPAS